MSSDHLPRTNRWLILLAFVFCFILGGLFTRSSAGPAPVVAEHENPTPVPSEITAAAVTATPVPDSSSSKTASAKSSSKKSSSGKKTSKTPDGIWVASGSSWMYLVDDKAFTGWLTDTDGKRYYFDAAGIMQTGWTDIDGKRYYMDLDGIMQTGDIQIDGKTYHLNEDGSLKGYKAKKSSGSSSKDKVSSTDQNSDSSEVSGKKDSESPESSKKAVALTFDDGPSSFTGRLLDCLEANNAKATFFMTGTEIESFPDEVKRMNELGCELGNHTYDHTDLTTLSAEEISDEISRVDQQLVTLTGQGASVVRPPYGSVNDTVRASVGTPMILWSIDTLDWKTQDVPSIIEEVMNNIEDGSVILMHDIFSTTVDAAEILIPQLIEDGYELLTVHELAETKGIELTGGNTYSEFH